MSISLTNPTFTNPEFRTGKKASWVTSSSGFLTAGATVEDDYFSSTPFTTFRFIHPRTNSSYTGASIWTKWVTNADWVAYPSAAGGCFPYVWSLEGAPSGMTIDAPTLTDNSTYAKRAAHGRIVWPQASITAGTHTFVLVGTDQIGTRISRTISLNVADSNAIWVDPVGGTDSTGAAGTKAAPFKKIDNWYGGAGGLVSGAENDTTYSSKIVIYRAGTVVMPQQPGTSPANCNFGANKPRVHVGYNGESVTLSMTGSSYRVAGAAGSRTGVELLNFTISGYEPNHDDTFQVYIDTENVYLADIVLTGLTSGGLVGSNNPGCLRNQDRGVGLFWEYHTYRNIQVANFSGGTNMTFNAGVAVLFSLNEYEINNWDMPASEFKAEAFSCLHLKHDSQMGVCRHVIAFDSRHTNTFMGVIATNDEASNAGNEIEFCCLKSYDVTAGVVVAGLGSATSDIMSAGLAWRRNTFIGGYARLAITGASSLCTRGANVLQNRNAVSSTTPGWTQTANWTVTQESLDVEANTGLVDSSGKLTGGNRTSYLNKKGWEILV